MEPLGLLIRRTCNKVLEGRCLVAIQDEAPIFEYAQSK